MVGSKHNSNSVDSTRVDSGNSNSGRSSGRKGKRETQNDKTNSDMGRTKENVSEDSKYKNDNFFLKHFLPKILFTISK